jgi:hypothetical protein
LECAWEGAAAWRQKYRKRVAAYYRAYIARAGHKKKRREYMRAYRLLKMKRAGKPREGTYADQA